MHFSTAWTTINVLLITLKTNVVIGKSVAKIDSIDLSHYGARLFGQPSKDVGFLVSNWKINETSGNPEELGSYVEGDILFPAAQARNGLIAETSHWPNAQIPFQIVGNFDAKQMDFLEKAINAYHENTCIKFVPKTATDEDYISIQSSDSGCWSSVGRVGGRQKDGCLTTVGTAIHELMHACGFTHEQNREERDDYVKIMQQNIKTGYENNFEKVAPGTTSGFGSAYDYGSVMHYSDHAFSVNGQPTIVSKKQFDGKMGQRDGFSKSDIEKINKMYNCKTTTASSGYKPQISISPGSISNGIMEMLGILGLNIPNNDNMSQKTSKKQGLRN